MNRYYYQKYLRDVESGNTKSARNELYLYLSPGQDGVRSLGFDNKSSDDRTSLVVDNFLDNLPKILSRKVKKEQEMEFDFNKEALQEKRLYDLGMQFLESVDFSNNDKKFVNAYIDAGLDVNFQHPKTKMTALHIAAGIRSEKTINKLIECGRCDYLKLDVWLRLPHELATRWLEKSDICERLMELEEAQMREMGYKDYDDYMINCQDSPFLMKERGLGIPHPFRS